MAGKASAFAKGYNSFSGVDIKGVFNNLVIAELQAISYSVTREKAPLYTMGSADPRSFSRGKRGIAGTLIFLVFDRHALLGTFGIYAKEDNRLKFMSDTDDAQPLADGDVASTSIADLTAVANAGNTVQTAESALLSIDDDQQVVAPWFSDQIP